MKPSKTLSVLLILTLLFACVAPCYATAVQEPSLYSSEEIDQRTRNIFNNKVASILDEYSVFEDENLPNEITIASITPISDFCNNTYTLIECDPTGYLIYHNESGIFVEYTPESHSPFYGHEGQYKYVGPNEYYVLESVETNTYRHALDNSELKEKDIELLSEQSSVINQKLVESRNKNVLEYNSKYNHQSDDLILRASTESWTLVNKYTIFSKMNSCGYINGGKCGYIAAGMLLTYDKLTSSRNCVTAGTHYTYTNGICSIKTALPTALYNKGVSLGYGASTTSFAIHHTVKQWLADRSITVNHTSLFAPLGNNVIIGNKIQNSRPVIWFGHIGKYNDLISGNASNSAGNHAVVVYGYKVIPTGYQLLAHFGWDNGYTKVSFTGILGSMYTFQ